MWPATSPVQPFYPQTTDTPKSSVQFPVGSGHGRKREECHLWSLSAIVVEPPLFLSSLWTQPGAHPARVRGCFLEGPSEQLLGGCQEERGPREFKVPPRKGLPLCHDTLGDRSHHRASITVAAPQGKSLPVSTAAGVGPALQMGPGGVQQGGAWEGCSGGHGVPRPCPGVPCTPALL